MSLMILLVESRFLIQGGYIRVHVQVMTQEIALPSTRNRSSNVGLKIECESRVH